MKTIGSLYHYDNGQARVVFLWDVRKGDGYAWSEKRQQRLASYTSLQAVRAAFQRSNNHRGAYGCAVLDLYLEDGH